MRAMDHSQVLYRLSFNFHPTERYSFERWALVRREESYVAILPFILDGFNSYGSSCCDLM